MIPYRGSYPTHCRAYHLIPGRIGSCTQCKGTGGPSFLMRHDDNQPHYHTLCYRCACNWMVMFSLAESCPCPPSKDVEIALAIIGRSDL
jgi:hypothetical protein